MKTRITTIILALLALTTQAQATDYGIYIAGKQITSSNYNSLGSIDGVSVGTNGRIYYDSSSNKLYLKNVQINKKGEIGIYNMSKAGLTIVFEECYINGISQGSWIESTNKPAIQIDRKTTFQSQGKGHGVVKCQGESDDLYIGNSQGIVEFTYVDISFQGDNSYGIRGKTYEEVNIENSTVEIFGGDGSRLVEAVKDLKELNIKGASTVTIIGNGSNPTVSGVKKCNLTDMAISSPSGAYFSSSSQTFCTSSGQTIKGDIEFTTTAIAINSTNFPDGNFLTYVSSKIDSDKNGYLTSTERNNVIMIEVMNKGISNLKGIEHFTYLLDLICAGNNLSSIDVSKNTELQNLSCFDNSISSLNLTYNTKLTSLLCQSNNLTSLNLTNNTQLSEFRCSDNQLTSLNLTYNTNLRVLECYGNNLTSIIMGNHPQLKDVRLGSNSSDTKISFDLHAYVVGKLPTVSSGTGNFVPGMYISKADVTKAKNKNWSVNYVGLEAYKLTDIIPDANFRSYLSGRNCVQGGWLVQDAANNVTELDVSSKNISDLTGISYFPNLWYLYCQNNTLTSLDLSSLLVLNKLYCSGNRLTSLNLSSSITHLYCQNNQLSSLNVSSLSELRYFNCSGNRLTSLNLSSNKKMEKLECQDNQLTSLTLPSDDTYLYEVRCYGNKLKGSYMTNTVNSLPYRNTQGSLYVATSASTEGNALNAQQRATLKSKKWTAYYLNSNNTWVPYEEGVVTGVEGVENEQQGNDDGTPRYNLQGQRVGNGYHGIVVRNGRKVIVRKR